MDNITEQPGGDVPGGEVIQIGLQGQSNTFSLDAISSRQFELLMSNASTAANQDKKQMLW
jgi:hypothetical protein